MRTGLTPHTLRFWENELKGILVPLRTKGRQRRYALEHLYMIEEIKRLKTEGLSLEDIKVQLNLRLNGDQAERSSQNKIDLLANRVAEVVRSVVQSFFEAEKSK